MYLKKNLFQEITSANRQDSSIEKPNESSDYKPDEPTSPTPVHETLPQIELQLPKRPLRTRLGPRTDNKTAEPSKESTNNRENSTERLFDN